MISIVDKTVFFGDFQVTEFCSISPQDVSNEERESQNPDAKSGKAKDRNPFKMGTFPAFNIIFFFKIIFWVIFSIKIFAPKHCESRLNDF